MKHMNSEKQRVNKWMLDCVMILLMLQTQDLRVG